MLRGIPERVSRVKGGTGFFWIEDKECIYVPPEKWPWSVGRRWPRQGKERILLPAEFISSVMDLGVQVGLEMYIGGSIVIDCSKRY